MGLGQMSLFDGSQEFSIDKPIRLIELFAGYGSQAFALKYLNKNFEHYKICEWAVKSIQAYKDAHFKEDNRDYSQDYSKDQIIDYLYKRNISMDYNEPMTLEEIKRLGETRQRQIFNNIKATNNLVDIQQTSGSDLEIVETDKYCYIMTYSFPCQDLSSAGLGKGMAKGSGTRSGMLWQVERLLDECSGYIPHRHKPKNPRIFSMTPYTDWYNPPDTTKLPQILLMENVPDVIGTKNIEHFRDWRDKLESLGYKCYYKVLNAKDYGVPQNRERCFMVSILGDYYYQFPKKAKLEKRLKDLLEDNVDEKYYLSERALLVEITSGQSQGNRVYDPNGLSVSLCANGGGRGAKTGLYIEPRICASSGRNPNSGESGQHTEQRLELGPEGLSNTLTTVQKDNYVVEPKCLNSKVNGKQPSVQDRIYDTNAISTAITTSFMPSIAEQNERDLKLINKICKLELQIETLKEVQDE